MEHIGILSLIPPIFVIAVAVYTKRIFETLIMGTVLSFILIYEMDFFYPFIDNIYIVMANEENVYLFSVVLLFGAMIVMIERSNGLFKFSKKLLKYCNTPKKSLLVVWILGILVFLDDYLNALVIGSTMKPITDKHKIPREMLAYCTNSTGSPVCMLIPLSTWVAFFMVVFSQQPELAQFGDTALGIYVKSLPFMIYPWIAVIMVPMVILGVIPIIGPMKKAYKRVEETGKLYSDESASLNEGLTELALTETVDNSKGSVLFFIIPMVIIIGVTIFTMDLMIGAIIAIFACIIMYVGTKTMTFEEVSNAFMDGIKSMVPLLFIIIGAFLFKESVVETGITFYLIEKLEHIINPNLLPVIAFIVVFLIVFASGTAWSVPALMISILVPMAVQIDANILLTTGAIVAGGVFGAHACLYSDFVVIVASCCRINTLEHTITQLPYCMIAGGLSFIGYLVLGYLF